MNKDILNEMYGMLSLLSIEKEALKKNLYYLLQHKNKSDNKQNEIIDVVYQMATSAIEYEKSLKDESTEDINRLSEMYTYMPELFDHYFYGYNIFKI